MRLAIIADIHGNSWALAAVLEDINKREVSGIYDLGDSLNGSLDPAGTFKLLESNQIESISGNGDRFIRENNIGNQTYDYVIAEIRSINAMAWLQGLPKTRTVENMLLCHGTPFNDSEYLIEKVETGYIAIKSADILENQLAGIAEPVIFCGHSHRPYLVNTNTKKIVNPGSVGLPAYDDDTPLYHKMETYSPMARYCIVNRKNGKFVIEHIAVSYDFEAAAIKAEQNNRNDWAGWLRTGYAQSK